MGKLLAIFFTSFIFIPISAFSLELKIFDQMGLMRAFTKVKEAGNVTIKLKNSSERLPDSINLSHVDGLSADKVLNSDGSGIYRADGLSAGSWRIVLPRKSDIVEDVKINE